MYVLQHMKKIGKKIAMISIFLSLFLARTASASLFVQCEGTPESPCGFAELLSTVNAVIRFILEYAVAPIAVIVFTYGGFLYLTSGGNASQRSRANKMFLNLGRGLFFCLAAWVIVKIILTTLGYDDTTFSPVFSQ